ncbi:MAG: glycosyltransferase [Thermoplasmata archaeon]
MPKKTFAVTVTYGDRFHLLKQVIEAALREGVDKVIVVDNNSKPNSRKKLKEYHRKNLDKIDVLYLPENFGSAGGFKRGLERAYNDPECEFIWLLDDDNKPQHGSLQLLKKFWKEYEPKNREILVLLSYREDRVQYFESLILKDPELVLGKKNSFYGFHIFEIPKYIKTIFIKKLNIGEKNYSKIPRFGQVAVAPYGGLFFNKKLLDIIGYPNEKLYVYSHDHEWTYRITRKGGKIILLIDSLIRDLEKSWHITEKNETMLSSFSPSNTFRIYYGLRNRVYFENKYLKTNAWIHKINCFIFLALILLHDIIFFKTTTTFKIALKAVKDANKNKLGRVI